MQTRHISQARADQQDVGATTSDRSFERSTEQRMQALTRANAIRTARATMKRAAREQSDPWPLIEQLAAPSEQFETMKVFDLLRSMPKIGRVKANNMLRIAQASPSKTVGGLSVRQRSELGMLVGTVARRRDPRAKQLAGSDA